MLKAEVLKQIISFAVDKIIKEAIPAHMKDSSLRVAIEAESENHILTITDTGIHVWIRQYAQLLALG